MEETRDTDWLEPMIRAARDGGPTSLSDRDKDMAELGVRRAISWLGRSEYGIAPRLPTPPNTTT